MAAKKEEIKASTAIQPKDKTELSYSERFTEKVLHEFNGNIAGGTEFYFQEQISMI